MVKISKWILISSLFPSIAFADKVNVGDGININGKDFEVHIRQKDRKIILSNLHRFIETQHGAYGSILYKSSNPVDSLKPENIECEPQKGSLAKINEDISPKPYPYTGGLYYLSVITGNCSGKSGWIYGNNLRVTGNITIDSKYKDLLE